jgi:hypothetical protein
MRVLYTLIEVTSTCMYGGYNVHSFPLYRVFLFLSDLIFWSHRHNICPATEFRTSPLSSQFFFFMLFSVRLNSHALIGGLNGYYSLQFQMFVLIACFKCPSNCLTHTHIHTHTTHTPHTHTTHITHTTHTQHTPHTHDTHTPHKHTTHTPHTHTNTHSHIQTLHTSHTHSHIKTLHTHTTNTPHTPYTHHKHTRTPPHTHTYKHYTHTHTHKRACMYVVSL